MFKSSSRRKSTHRYGRIAACMVGASVLAYMLAGVERAPLHAQEFVQKDVADQVANANAAVNRCDIRGARREIANLKKTKAGLDAAAKTGFVAGADKDAKAVGQAIGALEERLAECKPDVTVTGAGGETYGLERGADFAKKAIADAQKAARDCDRALFKAVIEGIKKEAQRMLGLALDAQRGYHPVGSDPGRPFRLANRPLLQLAADLEKAEAELFKNCPKPGTTAQPATPPATAPAPGPKPPREPDVPGLDDEPKPPAGGERVTPGQPPARPGEPPRAPTTVFPTGWEPFAPAMLAAATAVPFFDVSFALGVRNNFADGAYMSNGTQPGGVGTGEKGNANFGFYFGGYIPLLDLENYFDVVGIDGYSSALFALSALYAGGRFEITYLGGGSKVVLELIRHGPNGAVRLTEQERTMISFLFLLRQLIYVNYNYGGWGWFSAPADAQGDQYADAGLAQAPRARWPRWWPVAIHVGAGPSFVDTKITMTSNQVPGGGVFESASRRRWDTGWSFVAGAQTPLCRTCVFGSPLVFGVEGQWTWLPARDISVRSSTFGFTETGRVSGRSSSRVMFTLSVPFTVYR